MRVHDCYAGNVFIKNFRQYFWTKSNLENGSQTKLARKEELQKEVRREKKLTFSQLSEFFCLV